MMRRQETLGQALSREFGAAFGVLALIFLSFAHQPVYAQVPVGSGLDGTLYVQADYCGGGPGADGEGAFSTGCDACRIAAGIDLPPTYDVTFLAPTPTRHVTATTVCRSQDYRPAGHARAPPLATISL